MLCSLRTYTWATSVAGAVDPGGERTQALAAFLEEKVAEGFHVETQSDTHAIIVQRRPPFWRRLRRRHGSRYVVEVDEQGEVSMSAAEPIRN
jgi:hypothetical protein